MAGNLFVSFLIIFFFFFSATEATISDAPFMVAHKKVSLSRLKSGIERVSVSIDIYNQGFATAYDVSLSDDSWSPDVFDLVSGNISISWERLDAGSSVSHSFLLESKVKGLFHGAPAVIKFRVPSKAALQEAYSTPILPIDILAERPPEKKFESVGCWRSMGHRFQCYPLWDCLCMRCSVPLNQALQKEARKGAEQIARLH
ncbi:hypothetical protein AAC387_Pa02g1810 [Persea americana]